MANLPALHICSPLRYQQVRTHHRCGNRAGHCLPRTRVDTPPQPPSARIQPAQSQAASISIMEHVTEVPSVLQIVARNAQAKPSIPSRSAKSSSAYRGVSSQGNRWRARICIDKVRSIHCRVTGDGDSIAAACATAEDAALLACTPSRLRRLSTQLETLTLKMRQPRLTTLKQSKGAN